jgi:hypothetical protein
MTDSPSASSIRGLARLVGAHEADGLGAEEVAAGRGTHGHLHSRFRPPKNVTRVTFRPPKKQFPGVLRVGVGNSIDNSV